MSTLPTPDEVFKDSLPSPEEVFSDEIPTITLNEKEAEAALPNVAINVSLERKLPYIAEQAKKSFEEHPEIFSSPAARGAYYKQITKGYNFQDGNKITSAIMDVDPYLKKDVANAIASSLNPLGETIPAGATAAVQGIKGGVEKIGKTGEVLKKEGKKSAALNVAVGVGQTLLGAASAVVPELAAFNIASGGLQESAPEAAAWMAPFEKTLNEKYKEVGIEVPAWKENMASVGDFIANLVAFGALHQTGKVFTPKEVIEQSTPENIKKAKEKVDAQYAPHPNEEKISSIQGDILKNPDSPLVPILNEKIGHLFDEAVKDTDQKAKQATEESLLQGAKMQIEQQMEGMSEVSREALKPELEKINSELEKLNPKQDAKTIRSDEGQVQETGTLNEGSQNKSGEDLQLETSDKAGDTKEQITEGAPEEITMEYLSEHGEPVVSDIDAEKRFSNGERVFVIHEQDELPTQIKNIGELSGYRPEQIISLPPVEEAVNSSETPNIITDGEKAQEVSQAQDEGQVLTENPLTTGVASESAPVTLESKKSMPLHNEERSIQKGGEETGGRAERKTAKIRRRGTPKARRKIKDPRYKAALSIESNTPRERVLQHFISGGKINSSAIAELFGGAGKKTKGEFNSRFGLISKNAPGIDALAHDLWESHPQGDERFTTQDYRNAIEDVLSSHLGTKKMVDDLLTAHNEIHEDVYGHEYPDADPDLIQHAESIADHLSEEELQRIADDMASPEYLSDLADTYFKELEGKNEANDIAEELGYPHQSALINTVNKNEGTEYKYAQDIPEEVRNKYDNSRNAAALEQISKGVDGIFSKLRVKNNLLPEEQTKLYDDIKNIIEGTVKLGGISLSEAVSHVIKQIKNTDWYKKFSEKDKADAEAVVEKLKTDLLKSGDVKGITKEELRSEWDRIGIDEDFQDGLKQDFGVLADKAKDNIETGKVNADELANEYADNINKPVSDENLAVLLTRKRQLQNLIDELSSAPDTPENRITASALQDKYETLLKGVNNATTTSGRALRSVQMALEKDFSLATMKAQIKNIKGEALTEAESKKIEELHKEIEDLRKKNEAYEKEKSEAVAREKKDREKEALEKLNTEAKTETKRDRRKSTKEYLKKEREDLFKKLHSIAKESRGTLSANPIPAKMIPVLAKLTKNYIKDGVLTTEQFVDEIHQGLKNVIPGLTVDHVRESIFGKREKPVLDRQQMALKALEKKAQDKYNQLKKQYQLRNRTNPEKLRDVLLKWQRFAILSGVKTLGKLSAAATARQFVTSGIEEGIGWGISKALPKLAKDAPREGGYNVRAEAKNIAEAFKKATYKDILQTAKTGKGELDLLYGKSQLPPEALDFFGQLHSALKTMPKRGEFFRSFEKRMAHAISMGADGTDPLVQAEVAAKSYEDGQRTIFMNENAVVTAYQGFLKILENKGASNVSTALRFLLPIVKIPSNFVAETTSYLAGGVKAATVLAKGIENLTPEQKDYVLRNLKKQTLGATLLAVGYFNADKIGGYYQQGEKRKKDDVKTGDVKMFGVTIPHLFLHAPALEMLQFGATIKRIQDKMVAQGKEDNLKAVGKSIWGIASQQPFIGESARLADDLREGGAMSAVTDVVKGFIVPRLIQETAESTDKPNLDAYSFFFEEPTKRKPEGLLEQLESGVPGLREKVKSETEKEMEKRKTPHPKSQEQKKETRENKKDKEETLRENAKKEGIPYIPPR